MKQQQHSFRPANNLKNQLAPEKQQHARLDSDQVIQHPDHLASEIAT